MKQSNNDDDDDDDDRQVSPEIRRSFAMDETNSSILKNSRSKFIFLNEKNSFLSRFRIAFDRSIDEFKFIIDFVTSKTKFSQDEYLLKKSFGFSSDHLSFVHQHLLFLKTLGNSLAHLKKLFQTVINAVVLNNEFEFSTIIFRFSSFTSAAVTVRPV